MPRNARAVVPVLLLLWGCGDDTAGPDVITLTGTFIGSYTAAPTPGVVYEGVAQLTQTGGSVSGTLTTNAGRSANIAGSLTGSRLTATFTFTDTCAGSASTTADIVDGGDRLTGNYQATDCLGSYSGGYNLTRQK
jgi:hypothetical protein